MTDDEAVLLNLAGKVIATVGILIMVLSGVCTLVMGGGMVFSNMGAMPGAYIDVVGLLGIVLAVGAAGFIPGLGLFFLGRWMARRGVARPSPKP